MPEEELKNLPPEERIKKLKELEKQKKKEIEDAQKQIRESENELSERIKWKEKVPIPAVASEDVEALSEAEKEVVMAHKGIRKKSKESPEVKKKEKKDDANLEEITAAEKVELPPELMEAEYTKHLSQRPMQNLYEDIKRINEAVEEKGYVSREEERRIEYLSSAVERKLEDVHAGKYSFSEDVAKAASLTVQLGSKLRDVYHRNREERKYQS